MANHFRSGIQKLTSEELSAITSTLIAVIRAYDNSTPPENTSQFVDAYIAAIESNDRTLIWMQPNGQQHPTARALLESTLEAKTQSTVIG